MIHAVWYKIEKHYWLKLKFSTVNFFPAYFFYYFIQWLQDWDRIQFERQQSNTCAIHHVQLWTSIALYDISSKIWNTALWTQIHIQISHFHHDKLITRHDRKAVFDSICSSHTIQWTLFSAELWIHSIRTFGPFNYFFILFRFGWTQTGWILITCSHH